MPSGRPPLDPNPAALAADAAAMKPYRETIPGSSVGFDLVPIPAGTFVMGSPESEADRKGDEGPAHAVALEPFWIGRCEVTWDEYLQFMSKLDLQARGGGAAKQPGDDWADAVSRPTPPYVPMDFGYGISGNPAICMTQFAARHYTKWLSMKTGRWFRLPTEAEWEYCCRAGTTTAFSFGDDPKQLGEYAWFFDNSDAKPQPVGKKKPNPWGLFDMHGNVAEWTLDAFDAGWYAKSAIEGGAAAGPVNWPSAEYPIVARGGSWDDDADRLRSAARRASNKSWKVQDPQLPKSIWYFTDARFVGFRVVRPLRDPTPQELEKWWEPGLASIAEILDRQRHGGR
ncbi:MAG: formylglycine-generating enzyme family protein [Planctomycetes bacterium]|nr:formylglycine-generating enzyme family protein [Planctomycetota bacterium]